MSLRFLTKSAYVSFVTGLPRLYEESEVGVSGELMRNSAAIRQA